MSNKADISIGILIVSVTSIFALGMIFWPYMPKDSKVLSNLYYICTSSALYMGSVIWFLMAETKWVKFASCFGMATFSVNVFVELFLDPRHWTAWSGWLILIVAANLFLSVSIIEKLKSKRNGNRRSSR